MTASFKKNSSFLTDKRKTNFVAYKHFLVVWFVCVFWRLIEFYDVDPPLCTKIIPEDDATGILETEINVFRSIEQPPCQKEAAPAIKAEGTYHV